MSLTKPAWHTHPEYGKTLGPEVADLADSYGYTPDPEQAMILDLIFAYRDDGLSVAFETGIVVGRQNLKCLDVTTPLLTSRGWVEMGDLQPGDEVFHPEGHPVRVTAVSVPELGHDCYRVITTDGRTLITDADHLWAVGDTLRRRTARPGSRSAPGPRQPSPRLLSTRQMLAEGLIRSGTEARFQLPFQRAPQTPGRSLPIDPYLLGAWLGDGRSSAGALWCHADDAGHWARAIRAAGFTPRPAVRPTATEIGITWPGPKPRTSSLPARLRQLGVLGQKHVPDLYLTAHASQRAELLQGLLDTDGTIHHRSGQVTFTTTTRRLAESVLFLCRSLGWRPGFGEGRSVLRGHDYGPRWTVTFTPKLTDPYAPFRLPRKAARVRAGQRPAAPCRIAAIEPVPSRAVRCIAVGSPDGLYLAGRDLVPTHNTGVMKMAAFGWIYVDEVETVTWTAHELFTAHESFRDLESLIEGSTVLSKRILKISHAHAEEAIELKSGARIVLKTRTSGGGRGMSGDKIIMDEAYAVQPGHMGALMPTLSARPDPQLLYGSSAGQAASAVLRDLRDRGRMGLEYDSGEWINTAERLAWIEWAAPPPEDACQAGAQCTHAKTAVGCGCDKPDLWMKANPAIGGRISLEYLQSERKALPVSEFCRERMGWWDDPVDGATPISLSLWYGLGDRDSTPKPGSKLAVAIDVAPDSSMSAIGLAGWTEAEETPHVELVDHLPGTGWLLDRLWGIVERQNPCCLVLDPAGPAGAFERDLRNRGFVTIPKDQPAKLRPGQRLLYVVGAREYAQGCGDLVQSIHNSKLAHPDQQPLNEAVEAGRARPVAQAWAWNSSGGRDITPLVAVTLALRGLQTYGAAEPLQPFFLMGG